MHDFFTTKILTLIWFIVVPLIIYVRWRRGVTGSGLILTMLMELCVYYGLGGLIYSLPLDFPLFYEQYVGSEIIQIGFQQATLALVALGLGCTVVSFFVLKMIRFSDSSPSQDHPTEQRLAYIYILVGLVSYIFLILIARKIPTASAFSGAGWRLCTVGVCLLLWHSWQTKKFRLFLFWLSLWSVSLPLLTIVVQGFLGYGATIVISILAFCASFIRPRWKILLAAVVIFYLGFSFYVTYMRDRSMIREAVWGGASLGGRTSAVGRITQDFEWLDFGNERHLASIDERLNQNFLVGMGVEYLGSGLAPYAHGQTLVEALLSLIPRILWPSKTIFAGSGNIVADYTGLTFGEDTSVGVGPVLELYINFSSWGIFFGFLLLGTLLGVMDSMAGHAIRKGNGHLFAYFYLPGLSLVEMGGSFVEVVSSTAAGLVLIYIINRYFFRRLKRRASLATAR